MKQIAKTLPVFICFFAVLLTNAATAQNNWYKSSNSGLYYHTDGKFTWTGGSKNGYCNGYGTIQWYTSEGTKSGWYTGNIVNGKNEGYGTQYYSNGNKYYEGYWKNDMRNGYGTTYYENGGIEYQGTFVNDKLAGIDLLEEAGYQAGKYIMENIFDSGINLQTSIIKSTEAGIWLYVKFNGIFINTNVYEFVVSIGKKSVSFEIPYMNDRAKIYLTLKGVYEIGKELSEYFND
jgi:antitoxin component YwqK of YwqJK toxin-antitoxin module